MDKKTKKPKENTYTLTIKEWEKKVVVYAAIFIILNVFSEFLLNVLKLYYRFSN